MIYHFLRGNTFHLSPPIIESILKHAAQENSQGIKEHFFCIMNFSTKYQYSINNNPYMEIFNKYEISGYKFIDSYYEFFEYIKNLKLPSDKYIFHGSIQPYKFQIFIYLYLYIFRKKILAACNLICWGEGDFNLKTPNKLINYSLRKFHEIIFRKILCLYALSSEDLKLAREFYPKASSKLISYLIQFDKTRPTKKQDQLSIMVSHSGWPANMHVEAFKLLAKFKNKNIRIVCPLCYGDPKYIEHVIEVGQREFGDKFSYFIEIMPIEDYKQLIKSMDVYITAAKIQTGLFALTNSIAAGARVILRGNLFLSMQEYGFVMDSLESIDTMKFEKFSEKLSEDEYSRNIDILQNKYANKSEIEGFWKSIYAQE